MKWKVTMIELLTCIELTSCSGMWMKPLVLNIVWFDFEHIAVKETRRLQVTLQWWCVQWGWRTCCRRTKSTVFSILTPCRDMRADRLYKGIYYILYTYFKALQLAAENLICFVDHKITKHHFCKIPFPELCCETKMLRQSTLAFTESSVDLGFCLGDSPIGPIVAAFLQGLEPVKLCQKAARTGVFLMLEKWT